MKYLVSIIFIVLIVGCSGQRMASNITKIEIAMGGDKPPESFTIDNLNTMQHYKLDMLDYKVVLPSAKQEDFHIFGKWNVVTHYNRDVTLYLGSAKRGYPYHITITASKYLNYNNLHKAIETGDVGYIQNLYHKYNPNTQVLLGKFGRGNYSCIVIHNIVNKSKYPRKKESTYECFKFNKTRTKAKSVTIVLTYNDINNSIYTYEDLLKRSKRVLDSLYIKDGWDE